ncbi:HslU--HslV peptidase ATPase subunit [Helicobacter monodelphidis]|nr:HslU--HslV peptidase ATPase subunit [Helicobacter sp. 15-1451]
MTPREIVSYLDEYIIGQKEAKKRVAIALRNRYRRKQLDKELQDEVVPKNILMIGSTGVGKTEIARRMAKILGLPFIKVEASKYTEVGFVGRDVESMVRDLVNASIMLVKEEQKEKNQAAIHDYVIDKITQKLLPALPKGSPQNKQDEYKIAYDKKKKSVLEGKEDHLKIEIELPKKSIEFQEGNLPPEIVRIQESITKVFMSSNKESPKKEVTVAEAKEILKVEASEELLDMDSIRLEGLKRAEEDGIIFIDEIDKVAVSGNGSSRQDPSKEGVQRDLLPIVEGSSISTKYGQIKTDYILFIAAGAFHLSKPSDLIPELQGRFPLRVELNSLDEEILYQILTQPKNSLLKQYIALIKTEEVDLEFEDSAIRALAKLSQKANEKTEDIGARRLHTVLEKVLEEVSFKADEYKGQKFVINEEMVHQTLDDLIENTDVARYIL